MANKRKNEPKKKLGLVAQGRNYLYKPPWKARLTPSKQKLESLEAYRFATSDYSKAIYASYPLLLAGAKVATPLYLMSKIKDIPVSSLPFRDKIALWYNKRQFSLLYNRYIQNYDDLIPSNKIFLGDVIYQGIVATETGSLQMLSWLQPSSNLSGFLINQGGKELEIPARQIKRDLAYWKTVIDKANYPGFFETIRKKVLTHGLLIKDGIPYINDGTMRQVAPKAKIVQKILNLENGKQISQAWLAHRVRTTGMYTPGSYNESFGVLIGRTSRELNTEWAKSIFRSWNLRYYRLLDDPLEFLTNYMGIETGIEKTAIYKAFKNKLGVGGQEWYSKSLKILPFRHMYLLSKNVLLPYYGMKTIHETIQDIPLIPFNSGLLSPIINIGVGLNYLRATVGTPFRIVADALDSWSPGTSSLGVAAGNIAQMYLAANIISRAATYTKSTRPYRGLYELINQYTKLPDKIKDIFAPLSKEEYAAFKRAKSKIKIIPENILEKLPKFISNIFNKEYKPFSKAGVIAASAVGALSILNIIGGTARLLGGEKTLSDLNKEYFGSKNVPQYKNRYWVFGQTYFFGQDASYMGPNFAKRATGDYREKVLFNKGEPGFFRATKSMPIIQDIIAPYYLERANYRSQPYPITGPSQSAPTFLGPIYASTVGQLFKPTKYMHIEEWAYNQEEIRKKFEYNKIDPYSKLIAKGNQQTARQALSYQSLGTVNAIAKQQTPGGLLLTLSRSRPGAHPQPLISPYSPEIVTAKTISAWQEAIGFPGFISRQLIGDPEKWYTRYLELNNAAELNSISEQFYYQNLGDPGYTEGIRRIMILQNAKRKKFNYIKNDQPYWMPDAGFYLKFRHNDPYREIYRGYERIPGPGLTARPEFKHLKDMPYEEYPLEDRLKILADIAYTSEEFKETYATLLSKYRRQIIKDKDLKNIIENVKSDFVRKINSRQFLDYNDNGGLLSQLQYKLNKMILPTSELLPISPKEKLSIFETPIDAYKHRVIQGNESAIWQHPWRDFIRPFIGRTIGLFTDEPMPWVKEHRVNELYLDYLKYMKYSISAKKAMDAGNVKAANKFKDIAGQTTISVNPYKSIFELYPAIRKEDRPYFIEFASETDPDRRKKILEMTSPAMRRIYKARWELLDYALNRKSAPSKKELEVKIQKAIRREQELFSPEIIKEMRQFEREYGYDYEFPQSDWEGYGINRSMTEIKIGFLQSIGEDPVDYRIPRTEIEMLNEVTNPIDLFMSSTRDQGYNLLNGNYFIINTINRKMKNIIYNKSDKPRINNTIYTLEHNPRIRYTWERYN